MNIKVENNIPNVKVTVNKNDDGEITILLVEENKKKLGDIQYGETVKLGEYEFIVLGHGTNTTAVLTKNLVGSMAFGDDGDWRNSKIRKFCNGEFFNNLANFIGAENIINHTVHLMAEDGTGKELYCSDKISILTTDMYRQYREYLPAIGDSWLTATRVTHDKEIGYAGSVCFVRSCGFLSWDSCNCKDGVRPFCVLNSEILVS